MRKYMKYIKNGDKRKIYAHKARKKIVPNKQSVLFFSKIYETGWRYEFFIKYIKTVK